MQCKLGDGMPHSVSECPLKLHSYCRFSKRKKKEKKITHLSLEALNQDGNK